MKSKLSITILALVLQGPIAAVQCLGQEEFRAVKIYMLPPRDVSDNIRKALDPTAAYLAGSDGETIAEVWLRKEVLLKENATEAGYGALSEGTLVGVLHFPEGGSDFRGQAIGAGTYTLRYEQIPQDGNHMGASPEQDFLLLCPATEDKDLDATFDFDSLVELSRHATTTNHPGPLMLMRVGGEPDFPGVERNDLGHVALRMRTTAKAATWDQARDFPLALTLVGRAEF